VRDPKTINTCSHSSPEYDAVFGVTGPFSDRLAGTLRRTGGSAASTPPMEFAPFKFLGSTTLQAFLLQCGLLNGHSPNCHKNPTCTRAAASPLTARGFKRRRALEDDQGAERATQRRRGAGSAAEQTPARSSASLASSSDHVKL
jgi:hypothetical protein